MVVQLATSNNGPSEAVWAVLCEVMDPEIPVVSVVDLGIVREVRGKPGDLEVVVTPTYTGCPATKQIETDIRLALDEAGFEEVGMALSLSHVDHRLDHA